MTALRQAQGGELVEPQPRESGLVKVAYRGIFWRAEPVTSEVRPALFGKKRVYAPERRCGVWVLAPIQGLQK